MTLVWTVGPEAVSYQNPTSLGKWLLRIKPLGVACISLVEKNTSTKDLLCTPHTFIVDNITDDLKNLACVKQMVQYNRDVDATSTDDVSVSV